MNLQILDKLFWNSQKFFLHIAVINQRAIIVCSFLLWLIPSSLQSSDIMASISSLDIYTKTVMMMNKLPYKEEKKKIHFHCIE